MKLKTRVRAQHFMEATTVTMAYIVEVQQGRRWIPLGDKGRITRHASKDEAQKAADDLSSKDVVLPDNNRDEPTLGRAQANKPKN